jgi:peptidoglycan-N-acetylglucosamine deacetylase
MELNRPACLTTSWDDGHPLDLRIAGLLSKYDLQGTFYIPTKAPNETMSEAQVRELSSLFEIGAHTINHVVLTRAESAEQCRREIVDSKKWVEQITGKPCAMFCPPEGRFRAEHLGMVREAGYTGVRTVELMSLDFPRKEDGLLILPTTLQACPHTAVTYAKNLIKRRAVKNMWLYAVNLGSRGWAEKARALLAHTLKNGGVFHLWGHSWEIEEKELWGDLEEILALMGKAPMQVAKLTNSGVCQCAA